MSGASDSEQEDAVKIAQLRDSDAMATAAKYSTASPPAKDERLDSSTGGVCVCMWIRRIDTYMHDICMHWFVYPNSLENSVGLIGVSIPGHRIPPAIPVSFKHVPAEALMRHGVPSGSQTNSLKPENFEKKPEPFPANINGMLSNVSTHAHPGLASICHDLATTTK